ncbi:hypothetical protein D3C76_1555390 [compost metagenome]
MQGFYPNLGHGGLLGLFGAVVAAGQGHGQQRHECHGAQVRGEDDRHTDLPMMMAVCYGSRSLGAC